MILGLYSKLFPNLSAYNDMFWEQIGNTLAMFFQSGIISLILGLFLLIYFFNIPLYSNCNPSIFLKSSGFIISGNSATDVIPADFKTCFTNSAQ